MSPCKLCFGRDHNAMAPKRMLVVGVGLPLALLALLAATWLVPIVINDVLTSMVVGVVGLTAVLGTVEWCMHEAKPAGGSR